jgi:DNA-3-methyladenine glycosylase I
VIEAVPFDCMAATSERTRCSWAVGPDLEPYHDEEWGVPVHDDRLHFEFLVLEAAQAGLSWLTILKRRDGYRRAFCDFEPRRVAAFSPSDIERLLVEPAIIRNRRKIESAVANARAFVAVQDIFGSFDDYVWEFVGGAPVVNGWRTESQIPAQSELSVRLSADLRERGFTFVGPVVCYAHLQATGLVMDHVTSCFRWQELAGDGAVGEGGRPGAGTP